MTQLRKSSRVEIFFFCERHTTIKNSERTRSSLRVPVEMSDDSGWLSSEFQCFALTATLRGDRMKKKRRAGPLWRRGNIVRARAYLDNCRFHRGRRQILNSIRVYAYAYRWSIESIAAPLFRQLAGQAKIHRPREKWTGTMQDHGDGHAKRMTYE